MDCLINDEIMSEAVKVFDEGTEHMDVVRGEEIAAGSSSPFVHHLYQSFMIDDEDENPDILSTYLVPSMKVLADSMKSIKMLAIRQLPCPSAGLGFRSYSCEGAGGVPFRFTESYDMRRQGRIVTVDFIGKHVGNYHRMIINGPLHRHRMPFRDYPEDGHKFGYLYLPPCADRKSYGDVVIDEETEVDEFVRLPGLEENVDGNSMHRYQVRGRYCYYRGETLETEAGE
jgi:hypothetical protein